MTRITLAEDARSFDRDPTMPRLLAVVLVSTLSLPACVRPAEERALADREVGEAIDDGLEIQVEDGLAAVRTMTRERVELWAGAPVLELSTRWRSEGAQERLFVVKNVVPGSELRPASGCESARLEARQAERVTEIAYVVAVSGAGQCPLTVAPPAADTIGTYKFGLLSDVQEAIDRVTDFYTDMNGRTDLSFVIGAGDLTERGTVDQLRRFQRELESLHLPYYATLGNHELGTTPVPWHDFFGRASFHFVYRGVHFSMVDSGSATVDPLVYRELDDWLSVAKDSVHVVAMHIPPLDPTGVRNGAFANRNEAAMLLARLAAGGVDLTLYGHVHSYYRFDNAGIEAHIAGGGGAIPERFDGVGRHYLVVTVDPAIGITETELVRID